MLRTTTHIQAKFLWVVSSLNITAFALLVMGNLIEIQHMPAPLPQMFDNHILAALSPDDIARLRPALSLVTLSIGEILYEPGDQIDKVYFPNDVLISLLTATEGHVALEVALIGREGMVGTPLALGVENTPARALVQGNGSAWCMSAADFLEIFQRSPGLQQSIFHYIHALMAQLTQTAACTRFHVVEARLARRFLMADDYAQSHRLHLTHEFLASILGVRRVGVTKAAHGLQQQGLINYRRGEIVILDRRGLEALACACYKTAKRNTHPTAPPTDAQHAHILPPPR